MYSADKHAMLDGNIEDNYNFLYERVNDRKTRFIRTHLDTLMDYAMGCDHVVEMGVDGVNSTWAFLMASPKKLTCIDIQNVKAPKILSLACALAEESGIEFEFIEDSSLNVEIKDVDLLFIDTDHTYKQLKSELSLHSGNVKKYIACHDTSKFTDMARALYEFLDDNKDQWRVVYKTDDSCGLTIIERIV